MLQKPAESLHLPPEVVAIQKALLHAIETVFASTRKTFNIYTRRTSSRAARIWRRALTCYCAILCIMYIAIKSVKTVTITFLMRRTWKRFMSLQKMF